MSTLTHLHSDNDTRKDRPPNNKPILISPLSTPTDLENTNYNYDTKNHNNKIPNKTKIFNTLLSPNQTNTKLRFSNTKSTTKDSLNDKNIINDGMNTHLF